MADVNTVTEFTREPSREEASERAGAVRGVYYIDRVLACVCWALLRFDPQRCCVDPCPRRVSRLAHARLLFVVLYHSHVQALFVRDAKQEVNCRQGPFSSAA